MDRQVTLKIDGKYIPVLDAKLVITPAQDNGGSNMKTIDVLERIQTQLGCAVGDIPPNLLNLMIEEEKEITRNTDQVDTSAHYLISREDMRTINIPTLEYLAKALRAAYLSPVDRTDPITQRTHRWLYVAEAAFDAFGLKPTEKV